MDAFFFTAMNHPAVWHNIMNSTVIMNKYRHNAQK